MEQFPTELSMLKDIVDRISVGVFVVNQQNELVLWNGYMENYSQTKADDVVGKNIFESFPDLPKSWLEQKLHNVFVIRNFSFTSWEHRPYLFKFLHNRPITGGIDYMRQNCTFLPMKGNSGDIEFVCITLFDVTDTSIYESMLKNAVRSLAEASNRDGLTDVYNRRFLESSMSKEFSRIKRYGGTLSFIIIDLDHFKVINDTHGHLAGDQILKEAAIRLADGLRTADTLSRYGGEEFAVILSETPVEGAAILAQRLCDNLAASPVKYDGKDIIVRASLGVAEFNPEMNNYEEMIGNADNMLYRSKENGRNQITVYYPDKENNTDKTEISPIEALDAESEVLETTNSTEETPIENTESENTPVEIESTQQETAVETTEETTNTTETSEENTLAEAEILQAPNAELDIEAPEETIETMETPIEDAATEIEPQQAPSAETDTETPEETTVVDINSETGEEGINKQDENNEKVIYITIGNK